MLNKKYIFTILSALLIVSFFISLFVGAAKVSISDIIDILVSKITFSKNTHPLNYLISEIRLPRVLNSFFVGGILAISGTAMQALFKNPLADPSIIGISSGAALTAALGILISGTFLQNLNWAGISFLSLFTFTGAVFTSLLIFRLSKRNNKTDITTMLLAGIAINALCGAFTGLILFLSNDAQLRSITFWTMGSLGGSNWLQTIYTFLALVIALIIFTKHAKDFNALSLGETNAQLLGIKTEKIKRNVVLVTSLGVGVSVAFFGIIGFIGLVVPHMLRILSGPENRTLLPASVLAGAFILSIADTISRTLAAPAELPIGIITSFFGAPLFLYLLIKPK